MDYLKIRQGLRQMLETNNEKVSDRAEARLIRMSQKGYTAMMENHTMTVKKLEEVAAILNKPVSYFFVKEEEKPKPISIPGATPVEKQTYFAADPRVVTYSCKDCMSKQKEIDALKQALEAKEELLQMYREKKENCSTNSA